MGKISRLIFVLFITLQVLSLALADDPCQAYATDGKTCSMTSSGDGGYDCTCTSPATYTNIPSSLLPAEFNIKGVASGRCVDVNGVSQNNNEKIHIWDCKGKSGGNQDWSARPAPGGGYNLVVKHSGKCLTINSSSNIVQYDCNGGANQIFQFKNPNGQNTEIVNPASGKCLDVNGGGKGNGAILLSYGCHGQGNQLWNVIGL